MYTHRCRYLLVYNTISTQEYHSNTQHTAKTLGLTNYDFDRTGLRSFHTLLDHTGHHTQGRTHFLLQRPNLYTLFKENRSNSCDQLPVRNARITKSTKTRYRQMK